MASVAPYGSWRSPLSAERLVAGVLRLSNPVVVGDDTYWAEGRPSEGGRVVVVRRRADGSTEDVFGPAYSARTLVHEYGGLCFVVRGQTVYFSNFADQRMYRVHAGAEPEPITAEPSVPRSLRYAAPVVSGDGHYLYCVRERHASPDVPQDVVNDLVILAADGEAEPRVVADGHDFFSFPTLSPEGRRIAWISWDHPDMSWDATQLWEAEVGSDGLPVNPRLVAGGEGESVTQPRYAPDGRLHFISDRTGWWNLYADDGESGLPLAPAEEDFANPDWLFGQSSYTFVPDGSIVALSWRSGQTVVSLVGHSGRSEIRTPYTYATSVMPRPGGVVMVAGSPTLTASVVALDLPSGESSVLATPPRDAMDEAFMSVPEPIEFPTGGSLTAHAFFYPPTNPDFVAPPGELPPLLVDSHGGPTGATFALLSYGIQYWTSRGIAVLDVNYGGSSGYGRAYRERLCGKWGIVDLDDCVNAAEHLVASGRADGSRLLISGASAGGYTTMCALTFRDNFAAGASLFGVSDAGALARHTHKFESHYSDELIGPWPEAKAVYEARSPIFHTELLGTPLLLLQGLEDMIVLPEQSELLAEALRRKGVPVAYVAFEGEQHGFRKAENMKAAVEAQLYFFGRVLGFEPADELPGVAIDNEEKLPPRAT